jgi:hypothetical protein
LQKLSAEYKDKGVLVLMVNIDSERFRVGPFLKKNPPSATVVLSDGNVESSYAVQGIPLTLALDRKGMIRLRKTGFGSGGENELCGAIEALLNEQEKPTTSTK